MVGNKQNSRKPWKDNLSELNSGSILSKSWIYPLLWSSISPENCFSLLGVHLFLDQAWLTWPSHTLNQAEMMRGFPDHGEMKGFSSNVPGGVPRSGEVPILVAAGVQHGGFQLRISTQEVKGCSFMFDLRSAWPPFHCASLTVSYIKYHQLVPLSGLYPVSVSRVSKLVTKSYFHLLKIRWPGIIYIYVYYSLKQPLIWFNISFIDRLCLFL